ncbi:hypothetical protein [Paraburkholderia xenovorans]|uniref:hypothetical protein n=1 Tax=Paraburkholderia xenovorans TaxID=36873 RepID=UPI0038B6C11A
MATRIAAPRGAMRKAPQQARSRATIDAILDAAAHILGEPIPMCINSVPDYRHDPERIDPAWPDWTQVKAFENYS